MSSGQMRYLTDNNAINKQVQKLVHIHVGMYHIIFLKSNSQSIHKSYKCISDLKTKSILTQEL